jgi:hypothetical protein
MGAVHRDFFGFPFLGYFWKEKKIKTEVFSLEKYVFFRKLELFERTQRRKIAKQFSDGAGVSL